MTISTLVKLGFIGAVASAAVLGGPGDVAAQNAAQVSRGQICLSQNGQPTRRCVPAQNIRLSGGELSFQIAGRGVGQLKALAGSPGGTADEVEICIVNGANICPPEPFEIVWVCITTGMLAGQECPEPPENAKPGDSLSVVFRGR